MFRPDITEMVDWVLKNNDLPTCLPVRSSCFVCVLAPGPGERRPPGDERGGSERGPAGAAVGRAGSPGHRARHPQLGPVQTRPAPALRSTGTCPPSISATGFSSNSTCASTTQHRYVPAILTWVQFKPRPAPALRSTGTCLPSISATGFSSNPTCTSTTQHRYVPAIRNWVQFKPHLRQHYAAQVRACLALRVALLGCDGVAHLVERRPTRDPKTRRVEPCQERKKKNCEQFFRVKNVVLTRCRCKF